MSTIDLIFTGFGILVLAGFILFVMLLVVVGIWIAIIRLMDWAERKAL